LFDEDLLDIKQVPVFADREKQIVEEVIESLPQVISDVDDMRTQLDLVSFNPLTYLSANWLLSALNIVDWWVDFLLDRLVEIKFVQGVERDDRMQKMGRVEAARTYLFLVF
jgi:hypothetical protein